MYYIIYFYIVESEVQGEPLTEAAKQLSDVIDSRVKPLEEMSLEAPEIMKYAHDLERKAMQLESMFTNTRNLSGVQASVVYEDISKNLNAAMQYSTDAVRAANNATILVN